MISVKVFKNEKGELKGFECTGHAGYAEAGSDIVCSAVSMLVINTVNAITSLTKNKTDVISEGDTGKIKLVFPEKADEAGRLLVDSMVLGIRSVIGEYGSEYLQLIVEQE